MAIRHRLSAILALLVLLMGTLPSLSAQETTPGAGALRILPPDETYAGATRGEWDARWWQYTASFPMDEGPGVDVYGDQCGVGQQGPVFLLPPRHMRRSITYTCAVPAGMAIYVPLGTTTCTNVEPPPFFGEDEEALRACAVGLTEQFADVDAYLDRQPIPDIERYATTSPLFTLDLPENNVYGVPPGDALAVSSTYGFIIEPPLPGTYEITMSVKIPHGSSALVVDFLAVRVVVEAPGVPEPGGSPVATPDS
jgi:hypothetical protein